MPHRVRDKGYDDAAIFGRCAAVIAKPSYPFAATSLQICR